MVGSLITSFAAAVAPSNVPTVSLTSTTVQNVFNVVLALAGALAVAFVVWSGIRFTLSQGKPEELTKAREGIIYSLVGIVVVMLSFAIVNYVIGKL